MKILLVNYEYKPQCGGAGLGTYNMAKAFQKMGHQVTLLIGWDYRFGEPEEIEGVCNHIIKVKKKNIHQSTPMGLLKFVIAGMAKINQLTKRETYDMIQFYFSVPTGILKYAIHGKTPYIISLRGMDIPGFRNDKYKTLSVITKKINYAIAKKAAAVTSLSAEAGKFFTKFAPDIKINVIPNAVDYEIYHAKTSYTKKIEKFVSVSRLTGFKNLDLMIKAFSEVHKKYPDVILDIYGEGREKENLEELIKECNAEGYISLKGYAGREKLIKVLPEYDVFSLMSIGDSFGIVFIEAMSAGLPIICAKAGGPLEIIVENKTGLFAYPNNLEDTIRVIEYCIEHPEKCEMWGRYAREYVKEVYSIESIAKQHIELYHKCINDCNTNV